jgi:hypothetical protein
MELLQVVPASSRGSRPAAQRAVGSRIRPSRAQICPLSSLPASVGSQRPWVARRMVLDNRGRPCVWLAGPCLPDRGRPWRPERPRPCWCGPAVEQRAQFGHGQASGGATCPLSSPLSFCRGQQQRSAHSLAVGLPAVGLRARGCLAGVRLPLLRASPGMTPRGVTTIVTRWLVHASHYRGRVRERFRAVWRLPAPHPPPSKRGQSPVCVSLRSMRVNWSTGKGFWEKAQLRSV